MFPGWRLSSEYFASSPPCLCQLVSPPGPSKKPFRVTKLKMFSFLMTHFLCLCKFDKLLVKQHGARRQFAWVFATRSSDLEGMIDEVQMDQRHLLSMPIKKRVEIGNHQNHSNGFTAKGVDLRGRWLNANPKFS